MFVPIDAKADVTGSKKGKLTPAQHAQINAWCLASKTGILNCLGKCEATSPYYTATNNEATIVFHSGYVSICGRIVECEEGTTLAVSTPAVDTETGWIVLKYNLLASGENEFTVVQKKTTDGALVQQDLNTNPLTGTYEFVLYNYTATASNISLTRNFEYVPDIGGKLEQFITVLTGEGKPLYQYDETKGTIEERLDSLGFRSPINITKSNIYGGNTLNGDFNITKLGNWRAIYYNSTVYQYIEVNGYGYVEIGRVNDEDKPYTTVYGCAYGLLSYESGDKNIAPIKIDTNGIIYMYLYSYGSGSHYVTISNLHIANFTYSVSSSTPLQNQSDWN